jgi:hypothetical protein
MSATYSIAFCGVQPPACSCARQSSGMTADAFRILRDLLLRPGEILGREGEFLRLQFGGGEAADGHSDQTSECVT